MEQEKKCISARVIAHSRNLAGKRLISMVLVFPRIVLAEFNTHRKLSRNSASSRAIPTRTMLRMVKTDPFIPIKWMKDHVGMQGNDYFDPETKYSIHELKDVLFTNLMKAYNTEDADDIELIEAFENMLEEFPLFASYTFEDFWLIIRDKVVNAAILLMCLGLTKQIVNRLLEPFMWHTVICTASDLENFFALRAHEAAEIHIQELAYKMLEAYNESTPVMKGYGEWHIPFGDNMLEPKIHQLLIKEFGERMLDGAHNPVPQPEYAKAFQDVRIKIAVARCARVSYMNFEGKDDYEADVKLFDRLLEMGHLSPFEHVAHAPLRNQYNAKDEISPELSGNFTGWVQLRKTFKDEDRTDNRVIHRV